MFYEGFRQSKPVKQVFVMLLYCLLPYAGTDYSVETGED